MELTKPQKKIARRLIEIGLQREYAKGLYEADTILQDWKDKKMKNQESYLKLYKHIHYFDKQLGQRYDSMSGSNYLFLIAGQVHDGVISEEELKVFPEEIIYLIDVLLNRTELP